MSEFHLLIDDMREYEMDHIARTPKDGMKALLSFPVTHLYLDHDLGDPDIPTGYDVLVWALERGCVPSNVQLVTSNPVGRDRMASALENAGYAKKNHWFIKEL